MQHGNTPWQLTEKLAILEFGSLRLALDPRNPTRGICDVAVGGQVLDGVQLLQIAPQPSANVTQPSANATQPSAIFAQPIDAGETVVDAYIRGPDLVITYGPTRARGVEPQFCWRSVHPVPQVVGFELILAMQTSLWHGNPSLRTRTCMRSAEIWTMNRAGRWQRVTCDREDLAGESSGSLFVFRPLEGEMSYAEMVFPGDFAGGTLRLEGEVAQLECELLSESLEKGVIRKARLQAIFLPRWDDLERAGQLFEAFVAAAPPLTR